MKNLSSTIEAILFVAGKPVSLGDLAQLLQQSSEAVRAAVDALKEARRDAGVILLEHNGWLQLVTNAEYSSYVKAFLNAELRERLTDASLETLAIIAYKQPISRAEIEAIRGVNSQYMLRQLLIRGLVEKIPNPKDARSYLYRTTLEFMQHLGIKDMQELPDFEELTKKIQLPETSATVASSPTERIAEETAD
jgi:segregation and condensation protein B